MDAVAVVCAGEKSLARTQHKEGSAMPSRTKEIAEAKNLFQGLTKAILIQAGRVIAQARRAQGLTQKELAKLAGVSRSRLANLETGRFALTSPAVARRYNRDVDKLLDVLEERAQKRR
jgi:DNA-binding XRE family transcriptional regulator